MNKEEKSPSPPAQPSASHNESHALLAALTKLTETMLAGTQRLPPSHPDAVQAVAEYREIRASLQLHSENFITNNVRAPSARKI